MARKQWEVWAEEAFPKPNQWNQWDPAVLVDTVFRTGFRAGLEKAADDVYEGLIKAFGGTQGVRVAASAAKLHILGDDEVGDE